MPVKPLVLIAAALATLSVTAQAQYLGPSWETKITLKRSDLDMIHRTVDRVHGASVGTVQSWSNSETGNSGTIRLTRKYQSQDRPCEQLRYTLRTTTRAVSPEHFVFNSCRQPDGSWKIS